jgi:hypothetical protein
MPAITFTRLSSREPAAAASRDHEATAYIAASRDDDAASIHDPAKSIEAHLPLGVQDDASPAPTMQPPRPSLLVRGR